MLTYGDGLVADVRGSGPPVVAIAGGACMHPDYLGDLAGLPALVVPHLRGVGLSGDAPLQSFWDQGRDVAALLEALGQSSGVVLGHSAGTRVAIAWAAQLPSQVRALVLVTPPAAWLTDEPAGTEDLVASRAAEPAFAAAAAVGEPDLSSEATFNAWQQARMPMSYASWGPVEQAHASAGWWYLEAARAFMAPPPAGVPAMLARVTAPVLVVAGAQDLGPSPRQAAAIAALFPAGELAVVDDCGHFPWVEQPAAWRAAVDPFLAAHA